VGADITNFRKLALGRIDAVVTDDMVGVYTLKQMGVHGVRRVGAPLLHADTFMVFPKSPRSAELAAAFDRGLEMIRRDGTYDRIIENYVGPAPEGAAN
jgi:polar amino acid transport system substrate-binding protein